MIKLLCFFLGANAFVEGWFFTGLVLWYVCFWVEFK